MTFSKELTHKWHDHWRCKPYGPQFRTRQEKLEWNMWFRLTDPYGPNTWACLWKESEKGYSGLKPCRNTPTLQCSIRAVAKSPSGGRREKSSKPEHGGRQCGEWGNETLPSLVVQMGKNLPAMRETWVRSLAWEDPLETGRTTHSSILAWRIPWVVELQIAWHNWATFTSPTRRETFCPQFFPVISLSVCSLIIRALSLA